VVCLHWRSTLSHEPATHIQAERDGIYKRCAVLMPILDIRRTEAVRMDVTIAQGRTKER